MPARDEHSPRPLGGALSLAIDSLSGTIDLIDPTPLTADHAVEHVFKDFRRASVNLVSGATRAVTDNGVRTAAHDMTTPRTSETNFRTDYVYANGATAEHIRTWTSLFMADVAGSIQPKSLLPSGTWTVTGTSSWTRGHSSYSLTVTTNPPLHYNASCTTAPRFDAGTITAVVTQGTHTMTVSVHGVREVHGDAVLNRAKLDAGTPTPRRPQPPGFVRGRACSLPCTPRSLPRVGGARRHGR
jgi:hypothetical protein